jgi:hypothetical protein
MGGKAGGFFSRYGGGVGSYTPPYTGSVIPIPEPSTLALLAVAMLAVAALKWRMR